MSRTLTDTATITQDISTGGQLKLNIPSTAPLVGASLALGGATIGSNALAVTGDANISGALTSGGTIKTTTNIWIAGASAPLIMGANSTDLRLYCDAAGILAQVNGTNAQALRVYNTSTSSNANYERGVFDWQSSANVLTIGTENAGTGTTRNLRFVVGGVSKLDYGITNAGNWTIGAGIILYSPAFNGNGTVLSGSIYNAGGNTISYYNGSSVVSALQWTGPGGSVIIGNTALSTSATDGFFYIPTCAGTPTGVPTTQNSAVPMVYDTTGAKLWIYRGGAWHGVAI